MKPTHKKDIKRFSHSRINTFVQCPRKHHYAYVEQIEAKESAYTIPGKLFHEAIENISKGKANDEVYKEFKEYVRKGVLDMAEDTLEYIVNKYMNYYHDEFAEEKPLMVEEEMQDVLDSDGNYLTVIVDRVFEKNGIITLRDTKTTQNELKYKKDDVIYNNQLLLYVPFVEDKLGLSVNEIQIDEVRIAKLENVPLLKNGKPTKDKRQLTLVTYEDYLTELQNQGLETDSEYVVILEYLQQRGHPLFSRIPVQIAEQSIIDSNAKDFLDAFEAAKTDRTYRCKGTHCNWCEYKRLCDLDYHNPDTQSRQQIIEYIKNN